MLTHRAPAPKHARNLRGVQGGGAVCYLKRSPQKPEVVQGVLAAGTFCRAVGGKSKLLVRCCNFGLGSLNSLLRMLWTCLAQVTIIQELFPTPTKH